MRSFSENGKHPKPLLGKMQCIYVFFLYFNMEQNHQKVFSSNTLTNGKHRPWACNMSRSNKKANSNTLSKHKMLEFVCFAKTSFPGNIRTKVYCYKQKRMWDIIFGENFKNKTQKSFHFLLQLWNYLSTQLSMMDILIVLSYSQQQKQVFHLVDASFPYQSLPI